MVTQRRRRIDEIGEESRRRILDAAEELFGQKGFENTSFVDIAERSGISRGSIPWHFTNKEGLLIAVYERAVNRFLVEYATPEEEPLSIRALVDRTAVWLTDPATRMLYGTLMAALTPEDPVHERFVEFNRKVFKRLVVALGAIEGAASTGPARPKRVATVMQGAFTGLAIQAHLDPDFDLAGAMAALASMVERLLGLPAGDAGDGRARARAKAKAKA